jgi:Zn-dependent protease
MITDFYLCYNTLMFNLLFQNPLSLLIFAIALLAAVTIHEFAHAWVADKLGDPTPRLSGRLTLNPLAHLDPIGTLALLIARIGWGKPVPIDPYNLNNPRRDTALISLAGPASNLVLTVLLSLLIKILGSQLVIVNYLITQVMILNVGLAIFNLLPIPPLDGSKILVGFLPQTWGIKVEEELRQYGTILLIILIFPFFGGASLATRIIWPIIDSILNLLL